MAETIDELTIDYFEDHKQIVKQLEKKVLTRGSWTTIMYLFQERNKNTDEFEAPKATIRRYQKRQGVFKQQSKFNISSGKQAHEIASTLQEWFSDAQAGGDTPEDSGD